MYAYVQSFINCPNVNDYHQLYEDTKALLFNLLDSPVKFTQHIGGTKHFSYPTEPILDVLVGVNNLHDITSLDEKRLNYVGFYRLHHPYKKKVMMAKFDNMINLKQIIRLHIIQIDTPLFTQYLAIDHVLSTQKHVAQMFSNQKNEFINLNSTIRYYENQKQKFFDNLYHTL